MPINYGELIKAAEVVAEKEQMKVTAKYSICGAAFTACTTMIGGIIAGPVGLGIGGIVGGISSAVYTKGKFKSVLSIIQEELTEPQKLQLVTHLQRAVQDLQITDIAKLSVLILNNELLYTEVFKAVVMFLESDMKLQLH